MARSRLFTCVAASLCLILFAPLAPAQTMGEAFVVTDAPGPQQFPDVAYNSTDHTFLVVWEEVLDIANDGPGGAYDIFGVILDGETGQPLGEPVLMLTHGVSVQAPEVAYNSVDNEFILVARNRDSDRAIAIRIGPDGQALSDSIELEVSGGPSFFDPAARARVVSAAHNAADNRYFVAFGAPVRGHILFPNMELDLPLDPFGTGTNPSVACSSESNVYLIAWEDREARPTGSENLSAQVIDANGDLVGPLLRIRDQEFAEESPRVAYNPDDDEFLVIWDERIGFSAGLDPQTLTDVIGQRVSATGELLGDPIPIELTTGYSLRQDIDYSMVAGLYLAVWKGHESGNFAFADIFGRFIARDGTPAGDMFKIYDSEDDETEAWGSARYYDESKLPVVAADNQGRFLVVWEEGGTEGDPEDRDILARFVYPPETGVLQWAVYP